ncbi:MAG: class II aldolase/adducin family protein [Moorea sp. SIO4G2]|uniref:class II aldolase/adducin family protein n=2 Tax=Coleofasciculaceae TaxID=1892251 RepID=UPI0009D6A30F|nr:MULTISPECIES: class II aldolase/adducin family protein [Moorena]NEO23017.1 class II aldolase/adducin family protein [Moorena sp. SIO4A5]NEO45286.1 class II aldolase/adducin family protein [Moorena sp. SIO4A3]NEO59849.1 class II aldolase/adducin family protein [Moorena sp. SIO4G2]
MPGSESDFLINPFGLTFDEVKASNLARINLDGKVVGDQDVPVNPTAVVIHGAILAARPDINTVIHAHTPYAVAVSTLACGLLHLDQASMVFYNKIAYHDNYGLEINIAQQKRLAADLGPEKLCMIMRNHGIVVCGRTVAEAFLNLYFLEFACRTQVLAMSTGAKLNQPSEDILNSFAQQMEQFKPMKKDGFKSTQIATFKALVRMIERIDPSYKE